jgi:hypothetical protein
VRVNSAELAKPRFIWQMQGTFNASPPRNFAYPALRNHSEILWIANCSDQWSDIQS